MHPGFMAWWAKQRASGHCGAHAGCGPEQQGGRPEGRGFYGWQASADDDWGGGSFGVRRPLRFMAHKLELSEEQVAKLAELLSELKTERAQAAVDSRRTVTAFADLLAGEALDADKLRAIADERVKTASRVRDAVVRTLEKTHAMLDPEQRRRLAYLLRTGALTI
jgi:Spy/CpxP family protein refolding chaperone